MTKYCLLCFLSISFFTALTALDLPAAQTFAHSRTQDPQTRPQPSPEPADDVLRVETNLVTTLFTAFDRDRRLITTLRAEDLRLSEDGVAQNITLFERETDRPLTFVIMVDTSKSQERTLPDEKIAARRFVEAVLRPDRDLVAVVSFTGKPRIESALSNNLSRTVAAIDRVQVEMPPDECLEEVPVDIDPRCYTGVWDSVAATATQVIAPSRSQSRRALIVLTDGDDTSSKLDKDDAIKAALQHDVVIYGIGIGDPGFKEYKLEKSSLQKLAEKTGGRAFFPNGEEELDAVFQEIQRELRSQYVVGFRPQNLAQDGGYRKLKLEIVNPELRKQKVRLMHRQGYYAKSN